MEITFDDFVKRVDEDAKKELIDFIKSLKDLSFEEVKEIKKYLSKESGIEPSSNKEVDEFGDPIVKYGSKSQVERETDYWNTELD